MVTKYKYKYSSVLATLVYAISDYFQQAKRSQEACVFAGTATAHCSVLTVFSGVFIQSCWAKKKLLLIGFN